MVSRMNIKELRHEVTKKLSASDEASADASLIIMRVLNIDKTTLITGNQQVSECDYNKIFSLAKRVAKGEPVQYVIGECEFMSMSFKVRQGVLIPRSDTETLVETVIRKMTDIPTPVIWDICCGSGCIGLSLAKYLKNSRITLADISADAIDITAENAERLGLSDRVEILKVDVMNETVPYNPVDCIVSNPPYIKTDVTYALDKKVRCFEPHIALDGGKDGLDFYKRISKTANLKNGGLLAFEIGFDQGAEVVSIMKSENFSDIAVIKDIEGRDRVVIGYKRF